MTFIPKQLTISLDQVKRTDYTIKALALLTTVGYGVNIARFTDNTSQVGFSLLCIGILTEAATLALIFSCYLGQSLPPEHHQQALENENGMTWGQYVPYLEKCLLDPCNNPRRFFAAGTFLADCILVPAEVLLLTNYSILIGVCMPIYTLAKAVALALPTREDVALITFGCLKMGFSAVSFGLGMMEEKNRAVIIVSDTILFASGLLAVASGIKTFREVNQSNGFEKI